MTNSQSNNPIAVGIDDGYAYTKIALADGRLCAIPSRARIGQSSVTWIHQAVERVFEYETEDTIYSVGMVDGAPTRFEGYPVSGLNRVIVQHALQDMGLSGQTVHAISGLPVNAFYRNNGEQRREAIQKKQDSLKQSVHVCSEALPVGISFHEVIPEALAAWYDYVIVEQGGEATLDTDRMSVPVAIVDIGGRTTDYVVVKDQGIIHGSSGSLQCGMLDVKQKVADGIQERFDLESISEQRVAHALETNSVRLHGKDYDVGRLVDSAKKEVVERLLVETRRQLGMGIELDQILFVGGGTVALVEHIFDWFPHQVIAEHPAFANARGMLKYLRYVCEGSVAA